MKAYPHTRFKRAGQAIIEYLDMNHHASATIAARNAIDEAIAVVSNEFARVGVTLRLPKDRFATYVKTPKRRRTGA